MCGTFAAALLVACKILDDNSLLSNSTLVRCCSKCVGGLEDINQLEADFLQRIGWKLELSEADVRECCDANAALGALARVSALFGDGKDIRETFVLLHRSRGEWNC